MSFSFILSTPDGMVARGDADFLVIPTTGGEMGVLVDHAPVVAAVAAGQLRVTSAGKENRFSVGPGLVEVLENVVKLLVEHATTSVQPPEGT